MGKIFIILVVLFVAVMLIMRKGEDYQAFVDKARRTTAVVVGKEERVADPKTQRKDKIVIYRFEDPSGGTHTVEALVEYPDIWLRFRVGEVVGVFYDPNKISESYLEPILTRRLGVARIVTGKKSGH